MGKLSDVYYRATSKVYSFPKPKPAAVDKPKKPRKLKAPKKGK